MKFLADIEAIADPLARMTEAATIVREAEAEAARLREQRDLAALVLLRPFADAVADTNAARTRLRERFDAGEIDRDEYNAGLAENREKRRADLVTAKVKVFPVDVYEPLDVSRNLVNRIIMRMPNGPMPKIKDPWTVLRESHKGLPEQEQIIAEAQRIRNAAAAVLMTGRDNGQDVPTMTNADIARATGLTTARIAQLRDDLVGAR